MPIFAQFNEDAYFTEKGKTYDMEVIVSNCHNYPVCKLLLLSP